MQSVPVALSWQCWRSAFRGAFPIAIAMAGFLLLLHGVFQRFGLETLKSDAGRQIQFSFFLVSVMTCLAGVIQTQATLQRHFTLPISALKLVGWKMLSGSLVATLMYLVVAIALNLIFDARWSVVGGVLFVAASAAWAQAISWSFRSSMFYRVVAGIVATLVFSWWLLGRYDAVIEEGLRTRGIWDELTTSEVVTMLLVAGAAYVAAVIGVAWDRQGEGPNMRSLGRILDNLASRYGRRGANRLARFAPFLNRRRAMMWFELRSKGALIAGVLLLPIATVVAWCYCPWMDLEDTVGLCRGMTLLSIMMSVALGVLCAHTGPNVKLGSFRATQPVSDSDIAFTILKVVAVALAVAWVLWILGLAVVAGRFIARGDGATLLRVVQRGNGGILVSLATCMALSWSAAGLAASVTVSRKWLLMALNYVVVGGGILSVVAVKLFVPDRTQGIILVGALIVGAAAAMIGTLTAYFFAIRKNLITRWTVGWNIAIVAGIIGLITVQLGWDAFQGGSGFPYPVWMVLVGFAFLAATPCATAPLAVSWNRHQ